MAIYSYKSINGWAEKIEEYKINDVTDDDTNSQKYWSVKEIGRSKEDIYSYKSINGWVEKIEEYKINVVTGDDTNSQLSGQLTKYKHSRQ